MEEDAKEVDDGVSGLESESVDGGFVIWGMMRREWGEGRVFWS